MWDLLALCATGWDKWSTWLIMYKKLRCALVVICGAPDGEEKSPGSFTLYQCQLHERQRRVEQLYLCELPASRAGKQRKTGPGQLRPIRISGPVNCAFFLCGIFKCREFFSSNKEGLFWKRPQLIAEEVSTKDVWVFEQKDGLTTKSGILQGVQK